MNILEKFKIKAMLKECDFQVATEVISEKFDLKTASSELADRVEDFLLEPGQKTALKLINIDPMFTFYFKECCENGLYVRNKRKQEQMLSASEVAAATVITENEKAAPVAKPNHKEMKNHTNDMPLKIEQVKNGEEETKISQEPLQQQIRPNPPVKPNQAVKHHPEVSEKRQPAVSPRVQKPAPSTRIQIQFPNELKTDVQFQNVILTLQKDIDRLKHEIDQTVKEMENDFAKRAEGQQWIEICEKALHEFQEAQRILKFVGNRKKQ